MKKIILLLTGLAAAIQLAAQTYPAELDSSIVRLNKIKSVAIHNKSENPQYNRLNPEQKITFDRAGNIVSDEKITGHSTLYFYNEINQRIRTEYYNPDGKIKGVSIHRYDKNKIEHSYYEASLLVSEDIYFYSERGKLLRLQHRKNGRFHSETSYEYDKHDSLHTYTYRAGSNKTVQDRYGNLLEITWYRNEEPQFSKVVSRRKYSYDTKGNKILQTDSSASGVKTIRFVYDQNNKLIKTIDQDGKILYDAKEVSKGKEDPYSIKGTDPIEEPVIIDPYKYPSSEKEKEKKYNLKNLLISKLLFTDLEGIKTYETYVYQYYP